MTPDASSTAELLRATVGRVGLATAADGELVRRFADHRDDLAFAELVHRFAPAVYALCRRHLTDPGAIDDAFQAVFVLLARKAGGLTHPDRVGGWLAGAADRIARTARRRQLRRSDKLRPLESVPEPAAPVPTPTDLRAVLDDELAKLPPHYREVVLLCDVDGVARRTAAAKLGIPVGTLGNRLTRARAVLGRRLLRRGVLVAAGGVLSGGSLTSAPPRLIALAVRVALADSPPTELLSLLIPVVPPMVRAKQLLAVVAGLAVLGGAITGVVVLMQPPLAPPTSDGEASKPTKPGETPRRNETPVTMPAPPFAVKAPKRKPPGFGEQIWASAATPDGKRVVMAQYFDGWSSTGKLFVYDTSDWKEVAKRDLGTEQVLIDAVAITADGKRVFVHRMGEQDRRDQIAVWDPATNRYEEKGLDVGPDPLRSVYLRLAPDGKTLAGYLETSKDKKTFRIWDVASGETLHTIEASSVSSPVFVFADGGKTIAAPCWVGNFKEGYSGWAEWDVKTGEEKRRFDMRKVIEVENGRPAYCGAVAYTPDGTHVVVAGGISLPELKLEDMKPDTFINNSTFSGAAWVIDRKTGRVKQTLLEHRHDMIRTAHLSLDGTKVIVRPTLPGRMDRNHGSTYGPDDEFVELQQWDIATWERDWVKIVPKAERWKLLAANTTRLTSCRSSPS